MNVQNDIRYRMATAADVEALAELRWQMASEHEAERISHEDYIAAYCETVREELARGRYLAWLAESNGRAIACTVLIWWPMPPNMEELHRRRGYVSSVYTHPDFRRLGLARATDGDAHRPGARTAHQQATAQQFQHGSATLS